MEVVISPVEMDEAEDGIAPVVMLSTHIAEDWIIAQGPLLREPVEWRSSREAEQTLVPMFAYRVQMSEGGLLALGAHVLAGFVNRKPPATYEYVVLLQGKTERLEIPPGDPHPQHDHRIWLGLAARKPVS